MQRPRSLLAIPLSSARSSETHPPLKTKRIVSLDRDAHGARSAGRHSECDALSFRRTTWSLLVVRPVMRIR